MAGRAVIHHENKVVGKRLANVVQEKGHAFAIHGGQDVVARSPVLRAERAIGIGVFPNDLFADDWSDTGSGPASSGVVDSPEPGFVLKEYP